MSFEDWKFEVLAISPMPIQVFNPKTGKMENAKNPFTGQDIDPEGITQSLVEMNFTHIPSGKSLPRAEKFSLVTEEILADYARKVIQVIDATMAAQTNPALIGELNIIPQAPEDTRTQEQKDLAAFTQIDAQYKYEKDLIEKLKESATDEEKAKLDLKIEALKQEKDLAAAAVIEAKTKAE